QPPPKPAPPSTITLTGKVFAITNAGDLKQARFASLYLLRGDSAAEFNSTMRGIQAKLAAADARAKELRNRKDLTIDESSLRGLHDIACADSLVEIARKTLDLLKRDDAMVSSKTDEEGVFNVNELKPGAYTIIVDGRAGTNNAVWVEDTVLELGK